MSDGDRAPATALLVDDEPDIRLLLRVIISATSSGLVVVGEAGSGPEALAALATVDPDVIVLDHMMPGMTGVELASRIRAERPDQLMILCSAYLDDELRARAAAAGIACCVAKEDIRLVPSRIAQALLELQS